MAKTKNDMGNFCGINPGNVCRAAQIIRDDVIRMISWLRMRNESHADKRKNENEKTLHKVNIDIV